MEGFVEGHYEETREVQGKRPKHLRDRHTDRHTDREEKRKRKTKQAGHNVARCARENEERKKKGGERRKATI